jgi:cytoskeletal protein CcmA (bactofilin family)
LKQGKAKTKEITSVKLNDTRGTTTPGELSTLIGKDAVIEGKVVVKQSIRVDGRVKGEVEASDTVTVGNTGEVEGNIKAKNVVVGGKVQGSLESSGKITLEASSILRGDLTAGRLIIEEGAVFNGRSSMNGESAVVKPKPQISLENPPPPTKKE